MTSFLLCDSAEFKQTVDTFPEVLSKLHFCLKAEQTALADTLWLQVGNLSTGLPERLLLLKSELYSAHLTQ